MHNGQLLQCHEGKGMILSLKYAFLAFIYKQSLGCPLVLFLAASAINSLQRLKGESSSGFGKAGFHIFRKGEEE